MKLKKYIQRTLLVLAILVGSQLVLGQTKSNYAFKAAFLYRFLEYIDWPSQRSSTFNFAVLGKSPITAQMLTIAKEHSVKNLRLNVREYGSLDEIGSCHILFVPENCPVPLDDILKKFEDKPVLIVTEREYYAGKGAHINFVLNESKLKFEFNLHAIDRQGIKVSSNLLKHAIIVDGK